MRRVQNVFIYFIFLRVCLDSINIYIYIYLKNAFRLVDMVETVC